MLKEHICSILNRSKIDKVVVAGDHGRHHHLCQRDLPRGEGAQPGDHVRTIEYCIVNFLYPFPNNLVSSPTRFFLEL